jgi:Holliday junction resolvase RusA-like endonuclease
MLYNINPVSKPRMTQRDRWAKRDSVLRYFAFRDAFRPVMENLEPLEGIMVIFVIPMPKSWSEKKKLAMCGKPHKVRPDIDNFLKAILDCLSEDKHIYQVVMEKRWGYTGSIDINSIQTTNTWIPK